jgi:endo-1,4-beta-mannosidase
MPAPAERFRLGVNYWPAETAMEWLPRYDAGVVRRDFGRMAAVGMDAVRIFLRWEDVQPEPLTIDRTALTSLVDTADAATEAGVELIVTLFVGHMSGVNWIPAWAAGGDEGDARFRVVSDGRIQPGSRVLRNWYVDREIVAAQERLAHAVGTAVAGHPALWAWDLGNENSNCTIPPDRAAGEQWLDRMVSALRDADPGRLITVGTHMEDLESDRMIGPAEAARHCDFVCMHGYPIYAAWSAGPTDPHLVPFLADVTAWLAADTPVLFAEFGHPTAPAGQPLVGPQVTESAAAAYAGATLDALQHMGSIGALLWCYADYCPSLDSDPPLDIAVHERSFGLWRADGSPKPVVAEIAARRGRSLAPPSAARPWLDVSPTEFAADRRRHLARLYARYRRDLIG